jgi:microcystin degradation protein MlrC
VVTDGDQAGADALAEDLAREFWDRRFEFEGDIHTPEAAMRQGMTIAGGPVILVETSDCAGGGAAGDSVATLSALLAAGTDQRAHVPVVDPEAAALCHRAGVGQTVTLTVGHKLDPRWGKPISVTGTVTRLSDGRFTYSGGIWDKVTGDMGPTAVLSIGQIQLMISSFATYDWLDEQYQSVGLDAHDAKFVVAKNPMNYRMAYGSRAKAVFILDTPGPTPATLRHAPFKKVRRPYFPKDADIPGLIPMLLRGRSG